MKYAITLLAGYYLPYIGNHINMDVCLGIVAGASLALLFTLLFVGPTPAPRHATAKATVRKPAQRKARKIIEQPNDTQYGLNIFNYRTTEWGIA